MKKVSVIAAAVVGVLAAGQATASDLEFNGYMRAGIGMNAAGGAAASYGNGGSGHAVGRLGDEVDTYAEIALGKGVYEKDNTKFSIHTRISYASQEGNVDRQGNSMQRVGDGGPWDSGNTALREAYAKGDFENYTIWAGKRFYQRKDIHILDFYYLNNSGYGAGFENIDTGFGNFSAAVTMSSEDWQSGTYKLDDSGNIVTDSDGNPVIDGDYDGGLSGDNWRRSYKADFRLSGIQANENGSIDLGFIYGMPSLSDGQKANLDSNPGSMANSSLAEQNGMLFTFEHTQGNFFGGFNKFIVQYGTDGLAVGGFDNHAGEGMSAQKGKGYRFIDWGVIEQEKWNMGYSFIYGSKDIDEAATPWISTGKTDFYNAVVRPGYKWNDHLATVLELGYANERTEGNDWQDLTKVTLAQEWNAGSNFWARPSIRAYVSHYSGDKVDVDNNGNKAETMVGVQVEAWW
ncbi:maltoporin [Vibrio barjaei]|uniref:maltoporin n=1 Tax=Vibrio barjaei TaxID=1676683 RepID=UPI0007BBF728|nr:carbohydrate porin [Vibrio barjaei]OIN27483.1 maltoporin [Vibrio barjaei]